MSKTSDFNARFYCAPADGVSDVVVDFSGDTALESFYLFDWSDPNTVTESIDLSGCTALRTVALERLNALTSIDLSGLSALSRVYIDDALIPVIDLSNTPATSIAIQGAAVLSLDISGTLVTSYSDIGYLSNLPSLTTLVARDCALLIDLVISNARTTLTHLDVSGGVLDESHIKAILVDLSNFAPDNGVCDLSGGTNAPPSAGGLVAKANLEARGWTVSTNS